MAAQIFPDVREEGKTALPQCQAQVFLPLQFVCPESCRLSDIELSDSFLK